MDFYGFVATKPVVCALIVGLRAHPPPDKNVPVQTHNSFWNEGFDQLCFSVEFEKSGSWPRLRFDLGREGGQLTPA